MDGNDMPPIPIHSGDFFAYCHTHLNDKRHFDAIIGNPPFVRYQNFPEEQRRIAFYLMQRAGLHPNRLTNTWVPFLVAASLLLNPGGRLAMVIPAELLQVNYAVDHSTEKWTRYFLDEAELALIRALSMHPQLTLARHVMSVDVGIVTGLNDFFVLTEQQVQQHDLHSFTQPLVGRSAHLQGLGFTEQDWETNVSKQNPAFLLTAPDLPFDQLAKRKVTASVR